MQISENTNKKVLTIGGRKSLLSRLQISLLCASIKKNNPSIEFDFYLKAAQADEELQTPLWKLPVKGAFTSEFTKLLEERKMDIVVHSYKDLALSPQITNECELTSSTKIYPILKRGDQRDLLLFKKNDIQTPPSKILIYTSSLRRMTLTSKILPELLPQQLQNVPIEFESIRGNIPTRLLKLEKGSAQGILISKIALDRLLLPPEELFFHSRLLDKKELEKEQDAIRKVLKNFEFMILPLSLSPNAPAQGTLAVEIHKADTNTFSFLQPLIDSITTHTTLRERKELAKHGGGCHQRIGVACIQTKDFLIQYKKGLVEEIEKNETREANFELNERIIENFPNKASLAPTQWASNEKNIPCKETHNLLNITRNPQTHLQSTPPQFVFVSRNEAWPEIWDSRKSVLWAAGVKTMKKLAKRGIWVHGCADGLGENQEIGIDILMKQKITFTKLTHQLTLEHSIYPVLVTYQIQPPASIPDLSSYNSFFWRSSSQFEWFTNAYPKLLEARHACGPGQSAIYIEKKLKKAPEIFLDYKHWLDNQ